MRLILFACLTTVIAAAPSHAQFNWGGSSNGLRATGSVDITTRPDYLQMTVEVEGRSSDLPQAVEELKRRVNIAQQRLKELGAVEESVAIGHPQLKGSDSPEEARQMQMMMQQYGGGQRGKQMLEQTQSVSITQMVTARWPLSSGDDMQRLIETKKLTQKIRDRDIASAADKQPVSPAQEELAVEMTAMMEEYSYGEEKTKVGEPAFRFVARIPGKQYRDSVATAFDRAKQQIKTIAEATKTDIADPLPVSAAFGANIETDYYSQVNPEQPQEDTETGDYELLADDPNVAKCTVTVTALSRYQ